jgi:hypothetical protein
VTGPRSRLELFPLKEVDLRDSGAPACLPAGRCGAGLGPSCSSAALVAVAPPVGHPPR